MSVDTRCITHWRRNQQTRIWHRERGGLLFAPSIGAVTGQVDIVSVSGPNSTDRSGRYWLQLDYTKCLDDIQRHFDKDLHFVGYWHTHPESSPSLSGIDVRAITTNLNLGGVALSRMIAVVVGSARGESFFNLWNVSAASSKALRSVE